jgi:hypothetical protein
MDDYLLEHQMKDAEFAISFENSNTARRAEETALLGDPEAGLANDTPTLVQFVLTA